MICNVLYCNMYHTVSLSVQNCVSVMCRSPLLKQKLDGVGPVDKRPSTNKLHHFVQKEKKKKKWCVAHDMWHLTCDMWHVTHDMWHMTHDMLWGVNILSKFHFPSSHGLWSMISWRLGGKDWLTELIKEQAPPIGKIRPFSKMAVTFKPLMGFWFPSGFIKFLITTIWEGPASWPHLTLL